LATAWETLAVEILRCAQDDNFGVGCSLVKINTVVGKPQENGWRKAGWARIAKGGGNGEKKKELNAEEQRSQRKKEWGEGCGDGNLGFGKLKKCRRDFFRGGGG
jgi:hypothetical protein